MPKKAQKYFDYIDSEEKYTPRFVYFRGAWYVTYEALRIENPIEYRGYMFVGYFSDTAFSAALS